MSASGVLLRLLPGKRERELASFGVSCRAQIFNCTNLVIGREGSRICRVPLPLIGNRFKVTEIDTPIPLPLKRGKLFHLHRAGRRSVGRF